jgi:hypothetical protein
MKFVKWFLLYKKQYPNPQLNAQPTLNSKL